jgi:hypothetical protein
MNIDRDALIALIKERVEDYADAIIRGLEATATHGRGSTASLAVKIAHDQDTPHSIRVDVQQKLKHPRNKNADLTTWTDPDLLTAYDENEAPGQQRILGA